jgi:hypothetical protein
MRKGHPMAGKTISGYDVKKGDKFSYAGDYYEAAGDAHGEFNAYIPVVDSRTKSGSSEIIVLHGNNVTLIDETVKITVGRPDVMGVRTVKAGKTLIGTIEDKGAYYVSKPVVKAKGHTTGHYRHPSVAAARQRMQAIASAGPLEWVVYQGHEEPAGMFVEIKGPYKVHLRTTDEQEAREKARALRKLMAKGQYIGLTSEFESLAK